MFLDGRKIKNNKYVVNKYVNKINHNEPWK